MAHLRIPPIIDDPTFIDNGFETNVTYERSDDRLNEFALIHPDLAGPATLILASYRMRRNPNNVPAQRLDLSPREARLLRDFLNRPEVAKWLE